MDFKDYPLSLAEAIRAGTVTSRYLTPTPLLRYQGLSRLIGADVYVKHENHNPTGTFKIRGGLNLMHHLKAAGVTGVITYSTGNHGTSVATSAGIFGLHAVVVVPENSNPVKIQAIKDTGAELVEAGATFEEAGRMTEKIQAERGLYYAHPANEPLIINGVGTEFLEILKDLPDIDVMILPLGAGSEAAAAITVLKAVRPEIDVIAVQAEQSSAAYQSWKQGRICTAENTSFAGGVATGTAYELPFNIYRHNLADFITLTEEELYQGMALALHHTRHLAEASGASTIQAAIKIKDRLKGKKVVLQMSGGNASPLEIVEAAKRECLLTGMPE